MRIRKLRVDLDPDRFLNRVDYDSDIRRLASDTTKFVSPKDLLSMQESEGGEVTMRRMRPSSLERILRSARNKRGEPAYDTARIMLTYVPMGGSVTHQAFAEIGKLAALSRLDEAIRSLTGAPLSAAGPLVLRYAPNGESFSAIYVPPIVELTSKAGFERALAIVQRRLETGDEPKYEQEPGSAPVKLETLLERSRALLRDSNGSGLNNVLDGLHRALFATRAMASYSAVFIADSKRPASSIPLRLEDVIYTTSKPERIEDRFLGHDEEGWQTGWLNFKELGIDN